ncbi:M56 family metallopeptidase [uncultured Lacinutrix sp.]|uniref:M56 family metallopeptidase n=1 Tax=uncultured Lacinutrix sp. TaxID=574032 RepID=UPI002628A286|nr:M56 family metallopeptidase [uncultured Lacinutrix sp.]
MIHYILQTVIFQLLFLIVYDLFLKRETFFNYNRFYLLISAFLSVILPFIKLNSFKAIIPQKYIVALPEVIIGKAEETTAVTQELTAAELVSSLVFNWHYVLYLGCIIALVVFLIKLIKLLRLANTNPKTKLGSTSLVQLINSNSAFSFFNYIFLGDAIKAEEKEAILAHELEHVKEKHSLDLLFFEVLRILFWFNPLIYIYQNRIANLHEFTADAKAIKYNNKRHYYENLLAQVFDTKAVSFINPFFKQSLIKKRIIMLSKTKSKQINLIKYTLLIPMVIGMLFYTSCSQKIENDIESNNLEQFTYSLKIDEEMPEDIKVIHEKYETFLKENKEYLSWAIINNDKSAITYSIHLKSEERPEGMEETRVNFPDGTGYTSYFNFNYFDFFSSNTEKKEEVVEVEYNDMYKKGISFSVIDESPVFPGCDTATTKEELKKCFTMGINKFVVKHFNTEVAKEVGFEDVVKINTFFIIDKEGKIKDIKSRAPHPTFENEAKRVIEALPQFKPGKVDGKPVNVTFYLPIKFRIAK